ncbi:MAG: M23 family metallopeptidase [Chloroflexi bacterium]|nr:M23 family metallopeptidase [Chloroflexota bacterium]
MAESHIILLPQADYFQWVRATRAYVLAFGVNTTPDPVKAGEFMNITVGISPNGYPEQGDIEAWLKARFASARIDPVRINFPEELESTLQARVASGERYGAAVVTSSTTTSTTTTSTTTSTTSTPADDGAFKLYWPTDYAVITQAFGANPEIYSKWGLPGHEGVDIRAPMNTNIYGGYEGTVFAVENNPDVHPYGKHVRILHKDGYRTVYAHLAQTLVQVGEKVKAKQMIGKADSTGNSTGSHLHLTLKKDGATARKETKFLGDVIDPTPFLIYPDK